jgi:ribosomal protein S12 methylthiotransferase
MAVNPKVCHYLDMPLQQPVIPVLTSMRRNITNAETIDLIRRIREKIPGIAIRTTMLVSYPGETQADFDKLKEFVEEIRFERLGGIHLFS